MFSAATKTAAAAAGGYQISRSLRFNSADSANLSRTFSTTGTNLKIRTLSLWIKRVNLGVSSSSIIQCYNGSSSYSNGLEFNSSDQLFFGFGGGSFTELITTAVYRDPSAWYHIVVAIDTTQATASNRVKLYVNGVQVTAFATANYPSQNADSQIGSANANNKIGSQWNNTGYVNAYMTEFYFIDGQALTPSDFGETNTQTGVWQPKAYSGSYGTNGFYLNFSDNSNTTAATLGKDYSGNGNNWTPNNFSVTAGVGNDSLVDVPTPYGVDTGAGGEVRGNYATLNSLGVTGVYGTYTNGNLDWQSANTDQRAGVSTFPANTGGSDKWYCEVTIGSKTGSYYTVGVFGNTNNCYSTGPNVYWRQDGPLSVNGSQVATGQTYTQGDVIGFTYDNSAGQIKFYKNGSLVSSYTQNFTSTSYFYFGCGSDSTGGTSNYSWNFGQRPFAYTAPSGFKALCTQNLPTPTIGATSTTLADDYFNTVLYTGTGSTQSITGVGFQPDFVWMKARSNSFQHGLFDAVRGTGKGLVSNNADAEATFSAATSFNADGFTNGTDYNASGTTYVAWNWKANGAGSTNTAGSITSTVSVNTTSGFSIVTYTGTGANATVGHGLGVAPSMIIVKSRSAGSTDWRVFASVLNDNSKWLALNTNEQATTESGYWNTGVSSTVFGLGNFSYINGSGSTYVAYCFAQVAGYSAFGSYTGNGSNDGPFVYCGFSPKYVLIRNVSRAENWIVHDTVRSPTNVTTAELLPNTSSAEGNTTPFDILSNGFKIRVGLNGGLNPSGETMIFAAFAESPFKFALAR